MSYSDTRARSRWRKRLSVVYVVVVWSAIVLSRFLGG
jgi:hypothetical protein